MNFVARVRWWGDFYLQYELVITLHSGNSRRTRGLQLLFLSLSTFIGSSTKKKIARDVDPICVACSIAHVVIQPPFLEDDSARSRVHATKRVWKAATIVRLGPLFDAAVHFSAPIFPPLCACCKSYPIRDPR